MRPLELLSRIACFSAVQLAEPRMYHLIRQPKPIVDRRLEEDRDAHDTVQRRLDLGICRSGPWSTIDSLPNRSPDAADYQAFWSRSSLQSITSTELISRSSAIRRLTLFP
jgi:hypothetical protein